MKIAHVFVEHPIYHLDHTFTYACDGFDLQRGVRVEVPFGRTHIIGFVSEVKEISEEEKKSYGFEIKSIDSVIDEEPLINEELFTLADWMADTYVAPKISCIQCMLPAKLKPKSTHGTIKMEAFVQYVKDINNLTIKQKTALEDLKAVKLMPRAAFYQKYKTPGKKLIALGCAKIIEKEASAFVNEIQVQESEFTLSTQQIQALHEIRKSKHHEVFLLHGATGSGKTEVFLQLASDTIKQGKQVVFLVPEISLTPLMVNRVKRRFGNALAIYHSGLNAQEKYEQYQLVKHHKVQIVVGTRSAVFMPFDDLGLIIMDEEHDTSYKQDRMPRYHSRDIAIERGKYHDAKVVLASATPCLESYARALKKVYHLVEMPQRINESFPEVKLVEMRQAIKNGEDATLSNTMLDAIYERLQRKEQVILLLNRRGYTPILRCISCGHVIQCPHCDVAMSYHKQDKQLKCHTCGYQMPVPTHCPSCGSSTWRYLGMGTQKLEELVQVKFPQAKILRMDADTTGKKNAHEDILQAFANHEADILLGTQMIAKGLDFEDVTLVGIVNGDAMLARSDYRSAELTYDLLEQASGRSGRGDKRGEVIIQAYDIHHYAILAAANHQYQYFFQREMKYRHMANYPPYTYLVSMVFQHKQEAAVSQSVSYAMEYLMKKEGFKVLGPAGLHKIKDEERTRILLKGKDQRQLSRMVKDVYDRHIASKQKARLEIDLAPIILE
ncbi:MULTISPECIES: replication restart helicase PriA [Bacillota]|uniref:Replication restart protein PriA n=2 Tax=Amedibacillus TaxID=2749846 RepID=A0A7G9GJV2_9FIRM|nr:MULTISPECIES: primosomal protein N' [Bacillota]QNM11084.1 primosomal protein N' [[Eubacterium] hominis]MCH4286520.1 primosomal protein N' [Amedibacillus hominis]RGB58631.1 primosomal protein N' [Absiella sp. AM22-9]RGB63461.1 primosomal protein N' [Absiella sp. AM10-20]RGB66193.1 primosomal protein N' [Absiella sp. AM09-45]